MLCRNCGSTLEEGRKFCTACGAPQTPAGAGGNGGRMSTTTKVLIAVVAVLVAAGVGIAIYLGVSGTSDKTATTGDKTGDETTGTTTSSKGLKLAYINSKDIYTVEEGGANEQKLTTRGDIVDFAVSQDGAWIAYVAAPGTQRVIFKMKADGTGESQVTLPEKGLAENPAFDAAGKHIYFTRVTPEDQANIEAGSPYAVGFERYSMSANKVDHIYIYSGLQEQSIQGLFADPAGGAIYFNLFGSDYPSSVPHKLTLGTSPTDSVYMPMQRDTGKYSAVAFQLTSFSKSGADVSFYKQRLYAEQNPSGGVTQDVQACWRRTDGGQESAAATYVPSDSPVGQVSGMEFSPVSEGTYYLAKVASSSSPSVKELEFYKGTRTEPALPTGLSVSLAVQEQQYTPIVWHLLAVPK